MFDLANELDVPAADILQWLIDNGLTLDWKERYTKAYILDLHGNGFLESVGNAELITGHLINYDFTYLVRTTSDGFTELLPYTSELWEQVETLEYLSDLPADGAWEFLVDNDIATEEELSLLADIVGTSLDTLQDVLYARTGYRDFSNYYLEVVA